MVRAAFCRRIHAHAHSLPLCVCAQADNRKLLQRDEFERAVEASRAPRWPVDASGQPVGGAELQAALQRTLASRRPTSTAVDACWIALSGGSSYVSREEIGRQLGRWRPATGVLELGAFERSLVQGRTTILLGYTILFGLQALVLALFVVRPAVETVQSLGIL